MVIVGISGKAEHGKTTLANALKILLEQKHMNVVIQPIAQVMKEQAKMLGWDGKKDEKGRKFLQTFTNPIKEYNGEQCYAKWCIERARKQNPDIVLVDDVRMFPEVNYFTELAESKKVDRTIFVRVNRPGYVSSLTEEQKNHPTETQLDDYEFDAYLNNPGDMEGLFVEAEKLLNELGLY